MYLKVLQSLRMIVRIICMVSEELGMIGMICACLDIRQSNENLISEEKWKDMRDVKEKINRILSIISRDQMKVVFFGR